MVAEILPVRLLDDRSKWERLLMVNNVEGNGPRSPQFGNFRTLSLDRELSEEGRLVSVRRDAGDWQTVAKFVICITAPELSQTT